MTTSSRPVVTAACGDWVFFLLANYTSGINRSAFMSLLTILSASAKTSCLQCSWAFPAQWCSSVNYRWLPGWSPSCSANTKLTAMELPALSPRSAKAPLSLSCAELS